MTAAADQTRTAPYPRLSSLALLTLCGPQLIVTLDFGVMTVGLASIRESLGWTQAGLQWVTLAYALPFGGLLLAAGALGDTYGHRRVLIAGVMLTSLGVICAGLSPGKAALIVARALQGMGAAAMVPAALALISIGYRQGTDRDRALGVYGMILASGFGIGAAVGGMLMTAASWRLAVLISLPACLAVLVGAWRLLPHPGVQTTRRLREVWSSLLVTLACTAFVYAVARVGALGTLTLPSAGCLVAACVLLGAFVAADGTAREPMLPRSIARSRTLLAGSGVAALSAGSLGAAVFFVPQFAQDTLGYRAMMTGLGLGLFGLSAVPGGAVFPRLAARLGLRSSLAAVTIAIVAGLLLLAHAVERKAGAGVLAAAVVLGFGSGSTAVAFTILGTSNVARRHKGVSSGFLIAAQQLGSAALLAALVAVAMGGTDGASTELGAADSTRRALLGAAVVSAGILVVVAALRGPRSDAA